MKTTAVENHSTRSSGLVTTATRHHIQPQIASLPLAMTSVWGLKRGGAQQTSFKTKYITRRLSIPQSPVIASRRRRRSKPQQPDTSNQTQVASIKTQDHGGTAKQQHRGTAIQHPAPPPTQSSPFGGVRGGIQQSSIQQSNIQ